MHDVPLKSLEQSNDLYEIMLLLKEKGKCRYFGISNKTQDDTKQVLKKNFFQSVQLNFNLIDQR